MLLQAGRLLLHVGLDADEQLGVLLGGLGQLRIPVEELVDLPRFFHSLREAVYMNDYYVCNRLISENEQIPEAFEPFVSREYERETSDQHFIENDEDADENTSYYLDKSMLDVDSSEYLAGGIEGLKKRFAESGPRTAPKKQGTAPVVD